MKIGFDAKRIFQNKTGLGNYSRTLLSALSSFFPANKYVLFAPKQTPLFIVENSKNIEVVAPSKFIFKKAKSIWRSKFVIKDLIKNNIEIYHGLSHELPYGIERTGIKTVVTIHDLIFERYPNQYAKIDVWLHRKKIKHACKIATKIIAISQQTKSDLINYYKIDAQKIVVCYQSFAEQYLQKIRDTEKERIKNKYALPEKYFLYVGSIIERKGLLHICEAIKLNENKPKIPLVVIGKGNNKYAQNVKNFIAENKLDRSIIFLNEHTNADEHFTNSTDFPAIFQQASAMVYPSVFEGFGIPVLEAIASGIPVITSNSSSLPEAGGNASVYVTPTNAQEIADAMLQIIMNTTLVNSLIENGKTHIQQFTQQHCASKIIAVYKSL